MKENEKMIDCSKTENYFKEKARMTKVIKTKNGSYTCTIKCAECPLSDLKNGASANVPCIDFEMVYPDQAIFAVQAWSNEHPQKTYLTEFLRNYPHATLDRKGVPNLICPRHLGLKDIECCRKGVKCVECWNQPID